MKKIFLVILILIIIFIIFVMNKNIKPILLDYSEIKARSITGKIINEALDSITLPNDLYQINKNNITEIISLDLNTNIVNDYVNDVTKIIKANLKRDGKKSIVEIPLSVIFKRFFLSNFGIKLPISINVQGNINSYIKTDLIDYGINNAMVKVIVVIEIKEQIVVPFLSKKIFIKNEIPISIKLINGKIPNYYRGTETKNN